MIGTITTCTLAHSITLAGATLGFLSAPSGLIEALIALSIVLVALLLVLAKPLHAMVFGYENEIRLATCYTIGSLAAFWSIERVISVWI